MKAAIVLFLLIFLGSFAHAQHKEYDCGVVISQIYVKGRPIMANNKAEFYSRGATNRNTELKVQQFTLDEKGKPSKKAVEVDLTSYSLAIPPSSASLFLPPRIGKKKTPNHRLVYTYETDTMIVDFLNIPEKSFIAQPYHFKRLLFKPGTYVFNFHGNADLMPTDRMESLWLNYYVHEGITPESEKILIKYGHLTYTPPRQIWSSLGVQSVWKYEAPKVSVEQINPHHVNIRLKGNFLGRDPDVQIEMMEQPMISPYYQVEKFESGEWKILPLSIGIDFKSDTNKVATGFYQNQVIQQLYTKDYYGNEWLKPGKYRVSFVTSEKEVLTSSEFHLGMVEPNPLSPYQTLYHDSLTFPCHKLTDNDEMYIRTPFLPTSYTDSTGQELPLHCFRYFRGLESVQMHRIGYSVHPENVYLSELIPKISIQKVFVNDELYTGRIKFAFMSSARNSIRRNTIIDMYIVDYENGVPQNVKMLKDVDLETETRPIRDTND